MPYTGKCPYLNQFSVMSVCSAAQIPSTFSGSCESLVRAKTPSTDKLRERWWWKLMGRRNVDTTKTASVATDEEQSELESCIDDDDSGFINTTSYKRLQESRASIISAELTAGQGLDEVKKQQDRRGQMKFTKSMTFSITKLVRRVKSSKLLSSQDDLLASGDAATLDELKPETGGVSLIIPLLTKKDQLSVASKNHWIPPKRSWQLPRLLQRKKTKSRVRYQSLIRGSCESVIEEGQLVGGSELQTSDVHHL